MKRFLFITLFLTALLGICSVMWAATLEVPTTVYPTIQAAITAAATGDEILLQDDFTIAGDFMLPGQNALMIPANKELTLDLNGHDISADANKATIHIVFGGGLVLKDSSVAGTGKVINTFSEEENGSRVVGNYGHFTMNSGTLQGSDVALYNYNNMDHIGDPEFGTVHISGGTLTGGGYYCVLNCGDLEISGGSYSASFCGINNSGKLTITNNLISNGLLLQDGTDAENVEDKGTLIIENNAQITGVDFIVMLNGAKITAADDNNLGFPIGTTTATEECWIYWNAANENWESNVVNITQFKSYPSIQSAINAAVAGDVIHVAPGTYNEAIAINKGVSVLGSGAATTIIDPASPTTVNAVAINTSSGNVKLDGFTIKDSSLSAIVDRFRVSLKGGSAGAIVEISNNIIIGGYRSAGDDDDHAFGFYSSNTVSNLLFHHNTISNCSANCMGLERHRGTSDIYENNITVGYPCPAIWYMTEKIGTEAAEMYEIATRQYIHHNTINANGGIASGISLAAPYGENYNQYAGGKFTNLEISYNTISNVGNGGIQLAANGDDGGFYDAVITYNTITASQPQPESSKGIRLLGNVSNTTITNNSISGCVRGIYQSYCRGQHGNPGPSDNIAHDNLITGCTTGLENQYTEASHAFDASHNWWGDASGPLHATLNPDGSGNSVSNNVSFDPWWANIGMTAIGSHVPVQNVTQNVPYATIQAAINTAVADDEILVLSGSFENQHLLINKKITLKAGATRDGLVVLDGGGIGTVVTITTDGAVLQGFVIINSGSNPNDSGVLLNNVHYCQVLGNTITGNTNGITVAGGYHNTLNGNIIHDNAQFGIGVAASSYNTIEANTIYDNTLLAIGLDNMNVLTGDDSQVLPGSTNNIIKTNTIYNNLDGIFLGRNCDGNVIDANTISASTVAEHSGIAVWVAHTTIITNNIVSGSHYGIKLLGSWIDNFITGNTIHDNVQGIRVARDSVSVGNVFQSNATIEGNKIYSNINCGLLNHNVDCQNIVPVIATKNWWGHASGPQLVGTTPTGSGDRIRSTSDSSYVDFAPWWINEELTILSSDLDLFVGAPKSLIQGNDEQIYQVMAQKTEDLLGYAVQIKIPKADFAAPHDFLMGSAFSMNIPPDPALTEDFSTDEDWIYTVSAARFNQTGYTDPNNVLLFSFKMSSNNINNLTGSLIDIPETDIVLYGPGDPPAIINCNSTTGKLIIIDSEAPTMVGIPETSGLPLPTIIRPTQYGSETAIGATTITLSFEDNYNLDYIQYLIQPQTDPATVTVIGDFSNEVATAIDGTLWNNGGTAWPIDNDELNELADGTYEIFFLVVDDAGNSYVNPTPWVFIIDKTAPVAISWTKCLTTVDGNESIDLAWTATGATKYHVWALDYADCFDWNDVPAGSYPQYDPTEIFLVIPNAPDPRGATIQEGWTQLANDVAGLSYLHTNMGRGYFYYHVFAEDAAGNISAASQRRESISYWPGDVNIDSAVNATDISALSAVWGTNGLLNPVCDVGPTIGRTRRGLPTPDGRINIEDLMIFSMNYMNTNYDTYVRGETEDEIEPVKIEMQTLIASNLMTVNLYLSDNMGQLKGLNIPLQFGNGLTFEALENGNIWPEDSMMLYTIENNVLEISASTLGQTDLVEDNGLIASLSFRIVGGATDLELLSMIARDGDNLDIEILDNPISGPTDNEDNVQVIPETNYLSSNYPNPFNPTTTIQFGLNVAQNVKITIFNTRGQIVKHLVNGVMPAGTHKIVWDGKDNNNQGIASGMYFYRMETPDYTKTNKAILMK